MSKYRIAFVAEFESDLDMDTLASDLYVSSATDSIKNVKIETAEIEEVDYKKVDLTKV